MGPLSATGRADDCDEFATKYAREIQTLRCVPQAIGREAEAAGFLKSRGSKT